MFDDRKNNETHHRAGDLRHRRQGRDRLGHRRRAGPAQRGPQGGLRGREADRTAGWGRAEFPSEADARRLEQRRQPEQQPGPVPLLGHRRRRPGADPLPKRVRDIFHVPADRRTPAQVNAVFSYWRTTVPEWKDANARIEELWKQHPDGASQLAMMAREMSAADLRAEPRRFPQAGQAGAARRAGLPDRCRPEREAEPSRLRAMAGRPQCADHGPGDRQSRLASLLRHRPGRHQRGFRHPGRAARRIPSCSTGWRSSSWNTAGASSTCTG